jgi:hypothetical protein
LTPTFSDAYPLAIPLLSILASLFLALLGVFAAFPSSKLR